MGALEGAIDYVVAAAWSRSEARPAIVRSCGEEQVPTFRRATGDTAGYGEDAGCTRVKDGAPESLRGAVCAG